MKILEVTNLFSPMYGGVPAAAFQISKHLAKRGHNVTLYTSDFDVSQEYINSIPQVKVKAFKTVSSIANFHFTPDMVRTAKKEVGTFDVIHLHNFRTYQNIVVAQYANRGGAPYVLQAYGGVLPVFQKQGMKKIFDLFWGYSLLRNAGAVVAGGEAEVEEYRKMGVVPEKIVIGPHLYEVEPFRKLPPCGQFRQKFHIKEKHIVLFLGRIHPIKGIDFLVESFSHLVKTNPDATLVIVGPDGGYKSTLEEMAEKLGISSKVLFTDMVSEQDKLTALVDASVLVQTSRYERSPGSPFEAVLCGTPIIITKNTGAAQAVSKIDAGYLVDYGNVAELTRLIQAILQNPAEAKTKTEKARQYIMSNLSWEKGVEEYEKLYESLLTSRKSGRRT